MAIINQGALDRVRMRRREKGELGPEAGARGGGRSGEVVADRDSRDMGASRYRGRGSGAACAVAASPSTFCRKCCQIQASINSSPLVTHRQFPICVPVEF